MWPWTRTRSSAWLRYTKWRTRPSGPVTYGGLWRHLGAIEGEHRVLAQFARTGLPVPGFLVDSADEVKPASTE